MRTTVNIDEHVLARAKDEAGRLGLTLGEYVTRALQRESHDVPEARDEAPLPVYRGRFNPAIAEMSNAELQELMDRDLPLDKIR